MMEKINLFFAGLDGILRTPGPALGSVMGSRKWTSYFIFILVSVMILSFVSFPYAAGEMSEMVQDSRLGEYFNEQNIDLRNLSFGQKMFFILPEVIFLFIIIGMGAFFTYLFFGMAGAEGMYINYFALVTAASLIDVLFPKVIETASLIFHFNLLGFMSPAVLFPAGESRSFFHILVSRFDIFSIWYTAAIALGISNFSKLDIRKSMTVSFIYLVFKSLVLAGFTFFFMGVF